MEVHLMLFFLFEYRKLFLAHLKQDHDQDHKHDHVRLSLISISSSSLRLNFFVLFHIFFQCISCLVAFMLHIQLPLQHNFFPSMQFMKGSTPLSSAFSSLHFPHVSKIKHLLLVQFMKDSTLLFAT